MPTLRAPSTRRSPARAAASPTARRCCSSSRRGRPPAIRPDYELIAGAFAQVAGDLKGYSLGSHGVPNAATLAKLEQVAAQVTSPALSKAVHAISAWAATHCKA